MGEIRCDLLLMITGLFWEFEDGNKKACVLFGNRYQLVL